MSAQSLKYVDLEDVLAAARRALAARKKLERAYDAQQAVTLGPARYTARAHRANLKHAVASDAYRQAFVDLKEIGWKVVRGELCYIGPERRPKEGY